VPRVTFTDPEVGLTAEHEAGLSISVGVAQLPSVARAPHPGPRWSRAAASTLQAYFETGGIATETARRMHMSVRTVTYRSPRSLR
jgi:hypothetical protein